MKDRYSKYCNEDLWCVKEDGFSKSIQAVRESQFTLGNGLLGSRGVLEEAPDQANPGTYIAGIYDRLTSQVAELVNFPNPFYFKSAVNGEKLGAVAMDILEHKRVLNMRKGLLVRHTVYSNSKKQRYDYQSMRFISMADKNVGVMEVVLTPLDSAAEVEIQVDIDVGVHNKGVITEGNKRHFQVKELSKEDGCDYLLLETLEKHQQVLYRNGLYYKTGKKKVYCSENIIRLKLKKNQSAVFTKVFYVGSFDESDAELVKNKRSSKTIFKKAFRSSVDMLLKRHVVQWNKLWEISDVIIEGTADIQKNLRFNIYHMLICAHEDNGFSSIGARTLSGEGYRGHIFWDAEIYLLPFYLYAMPEVARNMLLYRYHRLDQAREIAKSRGYRGAMFPWESAGTGEEETPSWAKNLDGSVIQIKTDELEHHITADIAYATFEYFHVTGDIVFMKEYGYELVFEAARFWASRVKRNAKGEYEIRDVIGPDEFHEHVNNNAYTNVMARWNLLTGYRLYFDLKKRYPKAYKQLKSKLNFTDKEARSWRTIAPLIVYHVRSDKVIEEFDGFFRKRYIEIVNFDENFMPLLPGGVKVKDYNKTQLVKQADVLMFLYLLSDVFSHKTKESNFWYYVDRTLHSSSLSAAMHALMAVEVGVLNRAYQFFNVALRADISNLHGNTAEGIHAASLGGLWQSVVNGFAGIRIKNSILHINPRMPKTWQKIKCRFSWQGNLCWVESRDNKVAIKVEGKEKKKVRVRIFDKNHMITCNKEHSFSREKKVSSRNIYY